ncbi:MAG TPA: cytochrome P450 [Geminicoccus sp.]|uniref:cytochrome P450 n=1 Tax=Geminicoccus sp. TaxID=2024832 RepID=UPI002E378542|nr:cytochrome P450 [Geminicoccus sp.]HEX2526214.1 cytochrome P450 [Geminicoccus sp.]
MAKGYFGEPFFMDDPALLDDPFPALRRYQAEHPIHFHPDLGQWFAFRYDDVAALLRDPRLSADRMKGFVDQAPETVRADLREIAPLFSSWVLMMDGEAHLRVRRFINIGFNATAVQAFLPTVEAAARTLLDEIGDRPSFDVCAEYGFLLPAYVLSDFLGVRPEDRHRVVQWSVDFIDFFNIFPITVDSATRMIASARQMNAYTLALLDERRSRPRDDFLGQLARAAAEPDGPTPEEIVGNAMLLLLAGHVAVRNLIGNVVYLLDKDPAQRRLLQADPSLLEPAIEETLRFEPPVTLIPRVSLEPVELDGQTIPLGAVVQLSLAAANRDPGHFPDPDRFDITRNPKRILSFGIGPHGCAGAHLARLETAIALRELYRRYPDLAVGKQEPIHWYHTAANRGPINLKVQAVADNCST